MNRCKKKSSEIKNISIKICPIFESSTPLFVNSSQTLPRSFSILSIYIYISLSFFSRFFPQQFRIDASNVNHRPNKHTRATSSFVIATNRRSVFSHPILGKEKLGVPQSENVSVVLESDGTQVEDGEYFKTLANNTILLLLRHGERWCPTGVDIIRAGIYLIGERVMGLAYKLAGKGGFTCLLIPWKVGKQDERGDFRLKIETFGICYAILNT